MLLVHADPSSRTAYALRLLFERLIPVAYRVTQDAAEVAAHDGPTLVYGDAPLGPEVPFLRAHGLLRQRGIAPVDPQPFRWRGTLALFPVEGGGLPFDPLASAFYLASRYEEYGPLARDAHGRALPEGSVLYREGVLRRPVVNEQAAEVRRWLAGHFPRHPWPTLPFTALSTVDVDRAFLYRGQPPVRTLGGAVRQLLRGDADGLRERWGVLRGARPDPYDTFDFLRDVHAVHGVPLRYFLLLGRGGRLDRNLPPAGAAMRALAPRLAEHAALGIHPSYRSGEEPEELAREVAAFRRLTGAPPAASRQHYLRVRVPETYRRLLALGIREDYSMGYASEPGFRAGLAVPFPFYDLEAEAETALTLVPLAVMDGTLNVYRRMAPAEACETVTALAGAVRATGGTFVSLWHNDTVAEREGWAGWRAVFLHTLAELARHHERPPTGAPRG